MNRLEVRVLSPSPKIYGFVAQWNQSAGLLNLMLRVRVSPEPFRFWIYDFGFWIEIQEHISGSSNGRTADFESVNKGSNPLPEANEFQSLGVPQKAIRACLGSKCSQVQILPPRPFLRRRSPTARGTCLRNKVM